MNLVAHGIGSVQDLPVPTWLFYWGATVVLVVSFVLLGALWRRPVLGSREHGRALGATVSRLVLGPLRIAAQLLSVALFGLVWAAALVGDTDPFRNLAPTWVYVIFWLGVPALSVVFGNVWRGLSPWRALADAFVWVRERTGADVRPLAEYPERLGRWPGAVVIFAFVTLELAYSDPASPRALAFAIALYTYVALFGMAAFGREQWERTGEGFAVLFGLLALVAPLHAEDGRLRLRWPLTGLAGAERLPGTVAFVSVMLGSVLFDGYSRTTTWQDLMADLEAPYVVDRPGLGELLVTVASIGGLLTGVLLIALAYEAACAARALGRECAALARPGLPPVARADRLRLRRRALRVALPRPGPVRDPASLRSPRPRLEPVRDGRRGAEPRPSSRPTRPGTCRSARSSQGTSRGWPSRTTAPSRSSRTSATRSARSTRCSC